MPIKKRIFSLLTPLLLVVSLMLCAACSRAASPGEQKKGSDGSEYQAEPNASDTAQEPNPTEPNPTEPYPTEPYPIEPAKTARIPILLYHNIGEEGTDFTTISQSLFAEHIKALSENGFTAVSILDLIAFVDRGEPLPEKAIVITFDDGYLSNYEIAFPILKQYGTKATIFVIGSAVGHTTYKDTDYKTIPHFDYDQAREMVLSGLISIQSHTYDMHQWPSYETSAARKNILIEPGEDEKSYIELLKNDHETICNEIKSETGQEVNAVAYPLGQFDDLSQTVLAKLGVRATLATAPGCNTVTEGETYCLFGMNRYTIKGTTTVQELLEMADPAE